MAPTKEDKNTFNADKMMLENTSRQIVIGGKTWHPAKRNGNVAKRIAELGDPPDGDGTTAALTASMDYLYKNIAIMIQSEEGDHPDFEWLMEELEWNVAQDMLGFLNPDAAEAIAAATGPPTPPVPSQSQLSATFNTESATTSLSPGSSS
jgi:hypothetical protein